MTAADFAHDAASRPAARGSRSHHRIVPVRYLLRTAGTVFAALVMLAAAIRR